MAGRCASKEWVWAWGNGSSTAAFSNRNGSRPSSSHSRGRPPAAKRGRAAVPTVGRDPRGSPPHRRRPRARRDPPPLGGRVDHRPGDGVQSTLGERRERPDLLDVVSEELDAKRLASGAREHIHESSAHRDLAALIDAFSPLVAGQCKRLHQRVEADLAFCADLDRCRSRILRWETLGESPRRRTDEASSCENVERSRSLADEVCRWVEARTKLNTAARKERDVRRIGVPGDGLGCVARLLVLGKEAEQRSPDGFVERCQHEGKPRFRHACRGREVVRERTKTLAFGELGHESVERRNRLVHTSGGTGVPRLHRSRGYSASPTASALILGRGAGRAASPGSQPPPGALPCPY